MFADRVGAGILRWMGWEDRQAFSYAWEPREELQPYSQEESQEEASSSANAIPFPSVEESTRNAATKRATDTP